MFNKQGVWRGTYDTRGFRIILDCFYSRVLASLKKKNPLSWSAEQALLGATLVMCNI